MVQTNCFVHVSCFGGAPPRFGCLAAPTPQEPLGGAPGPKLFHHIAEYGDGWIPIGGRGIRGALPDLHRAAEEAGRDPSDLRVVPFGTIPDPGKLDYYGSLGIEEVVLSLPSAGADKVLAVLDDYAKYL